MNTRIAARLFVLAWFLIPRGLPGGLIRGQEPPTLSALDVTIYDLGANPQEFDGHRVRVRALFTFGWEGDNFLSDLVPRNLPRGSPAYVWLYCKPDRDQRACGQLRPNGRSIQASFTGYFHFVSEPQDNGVFNPGHLQLEATEVSMSEPSQSLADAIGEGDIENVRKILRSGVQVNIWDEHRSFPLFEAASSAHTDIVEELLVAGADPNLALYDGSTPLIGAAFNGDVKIARLLLQHGATVDTADANGETALLMALHNGSDGKVVQLLLDAGADPNARDGAGSTPLIFAAMVGDALAAENLLKAGADPSVKNQYGKTAQSESCDRGERGHFRVCELVRQALKKK